jgi:alanine racemase
MSDLELFEPMGADTPRAELVIDLDAIADNVTTLRRRVRGEASNALMMTVVKADG